MNELKELTQYELRATEGGRGSDIPIICIEIPFIFRLVVILP